MLLRSRPQGDPAKAALPARPTLRAARTGAAHPRHTASRSEPLGIKEISQRIVTAKGFDPEDADLRADIRQSIRSEEVRRNTSAISSAFPRWQLRAAIHGIKTATNSWQLFTDGTIHVATWTSREPRGFTDEQIAGIEAILTPLARVAEVRALRRMASTLLDTYVGHDAGERILAGHIRRGDIEEIHAAIWLSDMRGFTALADSRPPRVMIDLLNRYFDCQGPGDPRARRRGAEIHGRRAAGDFCDRGQRDRGMQARACRRPPGAGKYRGSREFGDAGIAVRSGIAHR
jgi:hypothetical protein